MSQGNADCTANAQEYVGGGRSDFSKNRLLYLKCTDQKKKKRRCRWELEEEREQIHACHYDHEKRRVSDNGCR